MDFSFKDKVGNSSFTLTMSSNKGNGLYIKSTAASMHCFLDAGKFSIGIPQYAPAGILLSITITGKLTNCSNQLYLILPSMMLHILEILEALKRDADMLELETMVHALYSSAFNFMRENDHANAINFHEAKKVYCIVQEWKRSPIRIGGTFSQYTPAGMPRYKFLNLISQLYNCSAAQLIYEINMRKAMDRLLGSDESIIMVSELSGYTNKENFITAFRNTYGVTPGYLRKHFRWQS